MSFPNIRIPCLLSIVLLFCVTSIRFTQSAVYPSTFHRRSSSGASARVSQTTSLQSTSSSFSSTYSSPITLASATTTKQKKSRRKSKSSVSKKTSNNKNESDEYETDLVPYSEDEATVNGDREPTLEEIRSSLGPVGKTIAAGVEVGIVSAGSFISGAVLGYGIGGIAGLKRLVTSSQSPNNPAIQRGFGEEIRQRVLDWNGNACKQAKSWAKLSAAFSGFHALSRVVRGGKEDKWNGIVGSAATGAFLSRKGE